MNHIPASETPELKTKSVWSNIHAGLMILASLLLGCSSSRVSTISEDYGHAKVDARGPRAPANVKLIPVQDVRQIEGTWIQKSIACLDSEGSIKRSDTAADVHNSLNLSPRSNTFREHRMVGGWTERDRRMGEACASGSLDTAGSFVIVATAPTLMITFSYDQAASVLSGECRLTGQFASGLAQLFEIDEDHLGTLLRDTGYFHCDDFPNSRALMIWERSPSS